jgi:metal-sulfur cluster biosynthetic enzyme
MAVSTERVMEALRSCFDPEIPVNIVDLGLVYDVAVSDGAVHIKMTLTSQGCPSSFSIGEQVKQRVGALEEVSDVQVEFIWEPAWDPSRISEAGRQQLGIEV